MDSPTSIANLALSHLAVSTEIQDVATEKTNEAKACRRFYEQARDEVFRDFAWPFATIIDALALVEEGPNDEWAYAYRYPSDALALHRLCSGTRNDSRQSRVPYRISRDSAGRLIYTDLANAKAEWTVLVEDPNEYDPDFIQALSLLLAAYIAPRVTGGDQFKLGDRALQLYRTQIARARANAANEEQPDEPPPSEFERARE